jgi:hypothetical protein
LLEGSAAAEVDRVVHAIAGAVPGFLRDVEGPPGDPVGPALLYGTLQRLYPERDYGQLAEDTLNRATDAAALPDIQPALISGFTGIAWTLQLLHGPFSPDDDPNEAIDSALHECVAAPDWRGPFDLLYGLVGFALYAIERLPAPQARACLEQIIARLDELAERGPVGITWRTLPEILIESQRRDYPHGYYNLGVAHGLPGVIAVLAQAVYHDVAGEQARCLLEGAFSWTLAQQLAGGAATHFPAMILSDRPPTKSRLAWCYGDAGASASLLWAARAVGNREWEGAALEVARSAALRAAGDAGVIDAGLCHGAAGLAHIFNRLWQATGDSLFAEAARGWIGRALAMRGAEGVAGFRFWDSTADESRPGAWVADVAFLTGATGLALALAAATRPFEPTWDRLLLVSVPPIA